MSIIINLQATNNITIKEAKETTTTNSSSAHGKVELKGTLKNEFVQIGYAVDDAAKAAEALKKVKESYSQYKNNLASQQVKLSQLKADFASGKVGIEQADIDEMQTYLNELKNDEAYYVANIALATTTLATKLTAVAAQGSKASSTTATFGFNAGAELDIDAIEQQLAEYKEKSIASNLHANNINIQANNTATIQGSNLTADNEINIAAKDTNIQASRDVATSKTSTKHQNITLGYEVYGGVTTSTSADTAQSTSTQLQHTNSQLQADTININTQETTTIKGANLHANQQLNINTNNLEVSSVQNTASSNSNSKSVNLSTSGFTPTGAGGSLSKSSSSSAQTLLTSLSAEEVNINVEEATTLKGATIASTDQDGNDNNNLNLTTNTLNVSSLNNTSNSKSISVGANIGGSFENNTLNNVSIDFSNNTTNKKTKTLATLGSGNIQITDQTSSDTSMLNRDIANNEVNIYDIESHQGLHGELDTRLVTQEGREEIADDFRTTGLEMQKLDAILPSATNENEVLATIGTGLNFLNTVTLGVTPSDDSDGGLIGQIPVLFGQYDINQKVLKVVSESSQYFQENKDAFIPIQESDYYKQASKETQTRLDSGNLYVSKEPITIDASNASYQNFTNGMMNNEADAIKNGISQTHTKDDTNINLTVNYNPTHGLLGDGLESAIDKFGGTTGMAEQTGEFIRDVTTSRGTLGSNFAAHSQGNLLTNSGVNYINSKGSYEDGGFMDREYFIDETRKDKEFGIPTFAGYGSPVNTTTMKETLESDINGKDSPFKFIGNYLSTRQFFAR